jgi:Flp pilus assembly secretin CpaC
MKAKHIQRASVLLSSLAATVACAQVASAWTSIAPPAENLNAIVQALNAEPSLKDSKITVQPDGDNVLLTGVAQSREQVQRASEIATATAGGAMVVNVMRPEKTTYETPDYDLQATAQAQAQQK